MSPDNLIDLLKDIKRTSRITNDDSYSEIFKKGKEINFPGYSISLLLYGQTKESKSNVVLNSEGWITNDITIPKIFLEKIKKSCFKGKISPYNKESIYNDAKKLKIEREKVDELIESELINSKRKTSNEKKKLTLIYSIIGTILILSVAGIFAYNKYYIPYKRDKEAARKYIIANTYKLRTSRFLNDNDLNIVKSFKYGQEVLVYKEDSEWAEVKIIDKNSNNEYTGFFGFPKRYLTNKKEFYEIDGIYGNEESRKLITGSYSKTAIINYLHSNNLMTDVPNNIQLELYKKTKNNPIWQVYGFPKDYNYNTVVSGKLLGNDDWCLAVIIAEKKNMSNRKLLIFSFDEENDNKEKLLYIENISSEFEGIKMLWKGSRQYLGEMKRGRKVKSKLQYHAIELGNNKTESKNREIIYFDGVDFIKYKTE